MLKQYSRTHMTHQLGRDLCNLSLNTDARG